MCVGGKTNKSFSFPLLLVEMMKEYRLLFTLLKLDAFFFFGYAIQVAALTDQHWQKGLEEIAFAIPLSGIIILLGFCAVSLAPLISLCDIRLEQL